MIITCKACNTNFNLDEKILKPAGSKVRCSVCSQVFTAHPQQATVEVAETETQPTDSQHPAATESPMTETTTTEVPETDSDLDSSLKEEPEGDLDDSDIEDAVSGYLDEMESGEQAASETDLGLPLDESDSIDDGNATIIADLDEEDLDFSLDIESDEDLDLDSGEELDLDSEDDLDLDLDLDSDDDLDLSLDLDAEDEDLDLSLDLQSDGDETIIADLDDEELDLDLSSLDNLLEDDQANESTVIVEVDEDDELSPDFMDESESSLETEADAPKEPAEELSLDLELDDLEEDAGVESLADDDSEVDLSEIEKMLEEPEAGGPGSSLVPDQDTDLDLDIEPNLDNEKWMNDSAGEEMVVEDEVIDLSELEQVLDDVDVDEKDEPAEEQELALEDALSSDADADVDSVDVDNDLELDLSEFEDDQQQEKLATADQDDDDMELEFEVEDSRHTEKTLDDGELEETVVVSEPQASEENAAPAAEAVAEKAPSPQPVKKKSSKLLVFLLILVILGGGGYGAYYWMKTNNIDIPFLSNYLNPKSNDPGNEKLTTDDINARFIDNTNVGKLFIITGKVKNGYEHSRGVITLAGNLYSSGKVLIAQEKIYCGNVMSDLELTNLELDKIKARLANRLGDNRSNIKIEPGQSIPFMVVFSGLPDDLEEYTIEVIGSTVLK